MTMLKFPVKIPFEKSLNSSLMPFNYFYLWQYSLQKNFGSFSVSMAPFR